MSRDAVPLELGRRAHDCEETAMSFRVALPFDRRLNQLRDLLNDAGFPADRKTVLAALIYAAPADGESLLEMVMAARKATVGDVLIDSGGPGNVVSVPRSAVGRPRRRKD